MAHNKFTQKSQPKKLDKWIVEGSQDIKVYNKSSLLFSKCLNK